MKPAQRRTSPPGRAGSDAGMVTAQALFFTAVPGHEAALAEEARACGFKGVTAVAGGVVAEGGWADAWRANLVLRGTGRVLVTIATFRVLHLAQLDKRARRVEWSRVLRADVPFRVEAVCRKSKIYHSGAAQERVARAIGDALGSTPAKDAPVLVRVKIEDDLCTVSIDTTGEPLHKRGYKEAVAKAPMRETLAALFLRQCGYTGAEPVLDPMCGSGTFVIEAAEIAAGAMPGRRRSFAFEKLATFDAKAWADLRAGVPAPDFSGGPRFHGSDQDVGAIRMSAENAERAGVAQLCSFRHLEVDDIAPPPGPPGLVIVNPPYGDRIGDRHGVIATYRRLGHALATRFGGWRVGLITSDPALARATGLPFGAPSAPVSHGGLRVMLFQTGALG